MNKREIRKICRERLGKWTERMVEEHATPFILLGIGHDHKIGKRVICTVENEEMTTDRIIALILDMAAHLHESIQ